MAHNVVHDFYVDTNFFFIQLLCHVSLISFPAVLFSLGCFYGVMSSLFIGNAD